MKLAGAECARQAVHQRIARWKKNLAPPNLAIVRAIEESRNGVWMQTYSSSAATAATPSPATARKAISPAIAKALSSGPSWLDPKKTIAAMTCRKKRTSAEVCRDNFHTNAAKSYYGERYAKAYKAATTELSRHHHSNKTRGKPGCGAYSIASKYNESMLTSPSDRKLKPTAIRDAVLENRAGLSPPKRGRREKIPSELCAGIAKQSAMMQVAGEGEASSVKMKALTEGLVANNKWEGVFSTEYCWRKARKNHPEIMNPVKAKVNEDRRVEWLSYKNVMDWTARAKEFLITIGMAKDEPGEIREYLLCISNDTFCHSTFLSTRSYLHNCRWGEIRYLTDPPRRYQLVFNNR